MGLRGKFSSLLSVCVVVAVFMTTYATTRFFTSEQETFIVDYQTNRALFLEHRVNEKFDLLHSQVQAVVDSEANPLASLLEALPALSGGEFWEDGHLVKASPEPQDVPYPPPPGDSRWAFSSSTALQATPAVRWIGRYGKKIIVLSLQSAWFEDVFYTERGALVQLVHPNGNVLVQSDVETKPTQTLFQSEIYAKMATRAPGSPETSKYRSDAGDELLGTFLALRTAPPVLITLHTPTSTVTAVIHRTYRYSAGIALCFLVLTLALGMLFSSGLTQPLRELDQQTRQVAQGKFDLPLVKNASRHDEVGSLSRSFARMGQDLKKMQEELNHAERMAALGKFSASIAHEIKNPLGGILINTQLAEEQMLAEPIDRAALKETLSFVREETWRADRIVKSLMKFARQDKPPLREIDFTERVKRTLAMLKPLIDQGGVKLTSTLPSEALVCAGNEDQIHEVLLNLIQNAMYAMKETQLKQLTVMMCADGQVMRLEIADSGHGMTEDVRQHLFEPFFTTKPIGEGTGLGLSVCHGIIKNHGGTIDVVSEPGKGTKFVISFPLTLLNERQDSDAEGHRANIRYA